MVPRVLRSGVALAMVAGCAWLIAPSPHAQATPFTEGGFFLARGIENAGAIIALSAGHFIEDETSRMIGVVDATGSALEWLPDTLLVDGTVRHLRFTLESGGRSLSLWVEGGLRQGAQVLADNSRLGGVLADACVAKGLPAAVMPGLVGALTGALTGVLGGPAGIVTGAATGALSGAWSGFVKGCTTGVQEVLTPPTQITAATPTQTNHRLRQVNPT
ncbi:hypothetical protein VMT65_12900 [Nocardia sp. CDC153]|uniref:hypothetical protein n=1 Tax=Nocardia sp. CDC153 TaxID=3112167 RepID=UPI002DC0167E|nr:hypothetical protein [Nocardia sp. CDC153]MEC3953927.1 hypothetical protein [Nocardia sp. CDC153]